MCHVVVYSLPHTGKATTTKCLEADDRFTHTCSAAIKSDLQVIHKDTDHVEETGFFISAVAILYLVVSVVRSAIGFYTSLRAKMYDPAQAARSEGVIATYNGRKVLVPPTTA